jgi:hypothetical protein
MMGNQMGGNQMGGNQMMGNQMMGNQMGGNQMGGNQMMGNQMMGNQMMGNQMGNNDNSRISESDLKKKLNDFMQDRNSVNVKNTGNFNPMMSPAMQNMKNMQGGNIQQMLQQQQIFSNGNVNFPKGGTVGISSAKASVASSYGVDLKKLANMSSSDIDKVISKIKNNVMTGAEELANKGSDNINQNDKKKLLDLIKKAKKINNNKKKKEESDDNTSSSEEEIKKPVKKAVKFKEEPKLSKKLSKLISINAAEHTEPEYFNDYMVDLPNDVKNVVGIELLDYKFPQELCFITKDNNQLFIIADGEEKEIELEPGKYSIDEIVEGLQDAFDQYKININIDIDNNEHIILSSSDDIFSFKNDKNSLTRMLGFTENYYEDEKVYKSENKHSLVSKIYLYIDNISNNEPFGIIDLKDKKSTSIIKKFNQPISEIREMILKFKRRQTKEDDLVDFYNKPHQITFKFESKN